MIERTFIQQNMKKIELEQFIKSQMDRAGFTGLDIVKTPLVTRIIVNVTHPGLAIGKSGQNIKRLTKELGEKFGIENPQLEIQEIKVPELDAKAVVDKIKTLLERGYSWRSVAYKTVNEISSKGAQGVEIVLSGALGGKGQRKRKQRIAKGYMKKTGDQVKLVDYAKVTSYPKYGAIGIKARIVRPETVFPDKINIRELLKKPEEAQKVEEKKEEGREETAPLGFEVEKVKEETKLSEPKVEKANEEKNEKAESKLLEVQIEEKKEKGKEKPKPLELEVAKVKEEKENVKEKKSEEGKGTLKEKQERKEHKEKTEQHHEKKRLEKEHSEKKEGFL